MLGESGAAQRGRGGIVLPPAEERSPRAQPHLSERKLVRETAARPLEPVEGEPRERIPQVVRVVRAHADRAFGHDAPLEREGRSPGSGALEAQWPAAGKRERPTARQGIEFLQRHSRAGCCALRPTGVRCVGRMAARRRFACRRASIARAGCTGPHQRPPPAENTITIRITRPSTISAIFHALFGYSPAMAPVTPFIAHW